jgi:phosphatidylglycerophosphate synthase
MDRFFVSFLLIILLFERALSLPQAIALLSREIAVVLFGCYLIYKKRLTTYRFRAIWTGKITTFFQFIVLISITYGVKLADEWLIPFALLGILAMIELYTSRKEQIT